MRVVAVVILTLLLLSPPAVSQVPDDKLIVPGQRIGKWTLEMTIADLDRMNGQGSLFRTTEPFFQSGIVFRGWPDPGLLAAHRQDQTRVECLILSILMSTRVMSEFKTTESIGVTSKWEEVFAAYRGPSWQTRLAEGVTRMVYDRIGVTFVTLLGSDGADVVVAVYVFRPGGARSIWR